MDERDLLLLSHAILPFSGFEWHKLHYCCTFCSRWRMELEGMRKDQILAFLRSLSSRLFENIFPRLRTRFESSQSSSSFLMLMTLVLSWKLFLFTNVSIKCYNKHLRDHFRRSNWGSWNQLERIFNDCMNDKHDEHLPTGFLSLKHVQY